MRIDLLSRPAIQTAWIPKMLCGPNRWKVLSGTWQIQARQEVLYLHEPEKNTGENIAFIGSHNWASYELEATVSILGESIKPPEGGAILYYHFRNPKNFYSLHLCLSKRKIEVIKRVGGEWYVVTAREFRLETLRKYHVAIRTGSAMDTVRINEEAPFEIHRQDIMAGCVGLGVKYCNVVFAQVHLTNSGRLI